MRICVLMLALGISQAMAMELETNVVMRVKEELVALHQDIPARQTDIRCLKEEGVCFRTNDHFKAITTILSNSWREVWQDLPAVTSNANDRLIVLAASIKPSEADFLSKLEALADLVLSNKVDQAELRWYRSECAIVDHYAASSLVRRYQEPAISNLIMKLSSAGVYSQGVSRIFSGEEKELYLDAVHDGLIGP